VPESRRMPIVQSPPRVAPAVTQPVFRHFPVRQAPTVNAAPVVRSAPVARLQSGGGGGSSSGGGFHWKHKG